jgi:hypothetical protein
MVCGSWNIMVVVLFVLDVLDTIYEEERKAG